MNLRTSLSLARRWIVAAAFLTIFLVSLENIFPDFQTLSGQSLNQNRFKEYMCLNNVVPSNEDVYFWGDFSEESMSGTVLRRYYQMQSQLAPRIVYTHDTLDSGDRPEHYEWSVGLAQNSAHTDSTEGMTEVAICDDLVVFRRMTGR